MFLEMLTFGILSAGKIVIQISNQYNISIGYITARKLRRTNHQIISNVLRMAALTSLRRLYYICT